MSARILHAAPLTTPLTSYTHLPYHCRLGLGRRMAACVPTKTTSRCPYLRAPPTSCCRGLRPRPVWSNRSQHLPMLWQTSLGACGAGSWTATVPSRARTVKRPSTTRATPACVTLQAASSGQLSSTPRAAPTHRECRQQPLSLEGRSAIPCACSLADGISQA